jgi:transposase-like protein
MFKVPHQVYTAEFKEAAVQRVKDGQGVSAVARELGMSTQTLRNWLKASEAGKLNGRGAKVVTAEQMELSRLRAENKRLQMELEIAKSGGVLREGPPVKYAWIDTQCRQYPLSVLCEVLAVSINGYRAWKRGGTPERQRLSDAQLLTLIRTIHAKYKGAYGSPRITEEVRTRGFPASRARVERLMSANGIRASHKRRYRVTTDSRHKLPVAPNALNRNFTPAEPNQVFASDITYIWTDEGWLYLAVTLDLFNREVVGWSVKPRNRRIVLSSGKRVIPSSLVQSRKLVIQWFVIKRLFYRRPDRPNHCCMKWICNIVAIGNGGRPVLPFGYCTFR